eukprot:TRINITY_DN80259_c0_g1_i1.p1 TRINITY_DN80259_c0_g1~~TRINITY_DN80259_c0_g1_i1.p1  ORF type:complete len:141 (+),score=40.15 TRINITY_DN80259_c0_g1_i1:86-508(+)
MEDRPQMPPPRVPGGRPGGHPGDDVVTVSGPRFRERSKVPQALWMKIVQETEDMTKGIHGDFTMEEVEKHNTPTDCWMVIRGKIFDVTKYNDAHPGGKSIMLKYAGKDATSCFDSMHPYVNIERLLEKCYVGRVRGGFLS